jgi:acetolactate synthase-1/2/3 large subunit
MTNTVADTIAQVLKNHGIQEVFGQSLPSAFFLAAARHGIRQVSYRTENAGGAMADAYARTSGRIGVVGAQNGPAATLLVPPMAEAMKASVPLLALVQEVSTDSTHKNAFQELDHYRLFDGVSKWTRTLTDPARSQDYVEAALRAATSGRPGPVVLLLPKDVLRMSADEPAPPSRSFATFPLDRVRPSTESVRQAAQLLAGEAKALVVAGGGVHLSGAVEELGELQELASVAVATTNMGKGAVSELHELSVGVIGNAMSSRSPQYGVTQLVRDARLVIFVGSRTNENGTDSWKLFPPEAQYVHIDVDSNEIGRNYPSHRVAGDAKLALRDLIDELKQLDLSVRDASRTDTVARISAARRDRAAALAAGEETDRDGRLRPEIVAQAIDALTDEDTILVADASYATLWTTYYMTAKRPGQRFLTPRGLAGLGWGYPMALGAKVAEPGSTVVCLTGDGGFGHVWAELETAVRERLAVVVVLLNNAILGYQRHAELVQFGDYTSAVDFVAVDHTKVAEAVGAHAVRVTTRGELDEALTVALQSGEVTLIEVVTAPDAHPPLTAWEAHAEVLAENEMAGAQSPGSVATTGAGSA